MTALQLAGNLLNLNPHLHSILTCGAFDHTGERFYPLPKSEVESFRSRLETLVRDRVLRGLLERGVLPRKRYDLLLSWRHGSGFSVHVGPPVAPGEGEGLERLARYVGRSHLADCRIVYREEQARVVYSSGRPPHPGFKNSNFRVFAPEDFVAAVVGFVPDRYQHQTVAYGEYANVVRGRRRKVGSAPGLTLQPVSPRKLRDAWRELMKRILRLDPLSCSCGGELRLVSVITPVQASVIERFLSHLGRWPPPKRRPRPSTRPPPPREQPRLFPLTGDEGSQVPPDWDDDAMYSQVPPEETE